MSNIFANFNAAEIEPQQSRDLLPAGKYKAVIIESETKATKAGTGERLNLTFQIIEGEYEGRRVWAGLNVRNPNEKAVEISMRELSAICRAVGVMTPSASSDLHDIPLEISVKIRPADGQYEASNEVNGYKGLLQQASAPKASAPTPPWKK